jgi:hypothetical protein
MPQVPIAPRTQARPLSTEPQQAARPGLDAAQLLQGTERLANAQTEASLRQADIANADALMRVTAAMQDEYRQFQTSLQDRRGTNAWGVTNDVTKWWQDAEKRHGDTLGNDVQRRFFTQQVAKLRDQSLNTVSAYEADQRRASLEQSAKASILASTNFAAANHANMQAVVDSKNDVLAHLKIVSDLNGWSPELKQAAETDALTNFHKQIIQAKVDSDPQGAAAYFNANKGEIAGSQQAEVEKLVRLGALREQAQAATDALASLPLGEALKIAREKYSGELEDEVVNRLKQRAADVDAVRELYQRRAADTAWDVYSQTKKVSAIPTALWAQLDGRTRLAIENEARLDAAGARVATDWNTYDDLRRQAFRDPKGFAQVDLRQYFPKLGDSERKQLIDLQNKAARPEDMHDAATLAGQLSNVHDLMEWTGTKNAEVRGKFDSAVTDAIDAEQKRVGRKLDYQERQKIIDMMLLQGSVPGRLFGRNDRRVFEVVGTPDEANFQIEIPSDARKQIEDGLRKRGVEPTDDAVLRVFKLWKGIP